VLRRLIAAFSESHSKGLSAQLKPSVHKLQCIYIACTRQAAESFGHATSKYAADFARIRCLASLSWSGESTVSPPSRVTGFSLAGAPEEGSLTGGSRLCVNMFDQ